MELIKLNQGLPPLIKSDTFVN